MNEEKNPITRRDFIKKSGKGALGLLLTTSSLPLIISACTPNKSKTNASSANTVSMVDLGTTEEIDKGPFPLKVEYKTMIKDAWTDRLLEGFVYISKDTTGNFIVMSPICTHLGCTVPYASDEMQKSEDITFFCPCHGGKFDEQGINVGGPPPRPFDTYNYKIIDGRLFIQPLEPQRRV